MRSYNIFIYTVVFFILLLAPKLISFEHSHAWYHERNHVPVSVPIEKSTNVQATRVKFNVQATRVKFTDEAPEFGNPISHNWSSIDVIARHQQPDDELNVNTLPATGAGFSQLSAVARLPAQAQTIIPLVPSVTPGAGGGCKGSSC